MKLIHPKFAASACLFALLAAPRGVFAKDRNDRAARSVMAAPIVPSPRMSTQASPKDRKITPEYTVAIRQWTLVDIGSGTA
jgi:hypothetical protein